MSESQAKKHEFEPVDGTNFCYAWVATADGFDVERCGQSYSHPIHQVESEPPIDQLTLTVNRMDGVRTVGCLIALRRKRSKKLNGFWTLSTG